jgi:hypothetical protein
MTPNSDRVLDPQAQFFSPALIDALVERETRLRIDYRQMPEPQGDSARRFIQAMSALLDFVYVSAVCVESAHRQGAKTLRDTVAMSDAICHEAQALTSLHPLEVMRENPALIAQVTEARMPSLEDPIPDLAAIVSASDAMVRAFPEKELTDLLSKVAIPEIGARIQVTLDGIRRFIKRNDPWMDQRLKLVGPEYAAGRLEIAGAALVLELTVPDTVAKLEECGYARALEHIELSADERNRFYQALRSDRLARNGKPAPSSATIARDVIATQRIESVDARSWVEQKLM